MHSCMSRQGHNAHYSSQSYTFVHPDQHSSCSLSLFLFTGAGSANSIFPGWGSFSGCVVGAFLPPRPAEQRPFSSSVCKAAHLTGKMMCQSTRSNHILIKTPSFFVISEANNWDQLVEYLWSSDSSTMSRWLLACCFIFHTSAKILVYLENHWKVLCHC